jgi:ABC-type multidrug transport system fused ATPase/permease subunit
MVNYLFRSFQTIYKIKKSWLYTTIFFRIVNGLIPLAELWILQILVNKVLIYITTNNGNLVYILKLIFMQFAISIIRSGINQYSNFLDISMEKTLDYQLGKMIMTKLSNVPYYYFEIPSFYNHQFRIRNNNGNRFLRPIKNILEALQNCISIISVISLLFFTHWALVIMGVVVAIPTFLTQFKHGNLMFNLMKDQTDKLREVNYLNGLFGNKESAKEIKLFNLETILSQKWKEIILNHNSQVLKILEKQKNRNIGIDAFSAFLVTSAAILTLYILKIKKLNIGNFVTILQSLKQLQSAVNQTSLLVAGILESSLYIKDFFDFIDYNYEDKIENKKLKKNINTNIGFNIFAENISIQNLYYKYPISENFTLKNISLNIKLNEKIAIVGDNGSGKSTLIKILAGLYPPTKGKVFFFNKEIRDINEFDLRKSLTVIFQDFVKFAYSIRENISFSDISEINNDIKIKKTAALTGVDQIVKKFKDGYETNLGKILPNSVDISGGEWQKIALSRALFKDSDIIILDEPTAALDPETELYIFNKFLELVKDKTAIFISHRMASARMADRIIVMRNGEIVEEGTHEALIRKKEVYYKMYESQATWYQ